MRQNPIHLLKIINLYQMKNILLILFLIGHTFVYSQNFVKTWEKCYGGTDDDEVRSIIPYKDGCLLFGSTHSQDGDVTNNPYGGGAWLLQLDNKGNKMFDRCYNGIDWASGNTILEADNDELYLLGNTWNSGADTAGYWIAKADTNFNILWQNVYGGSSIDHLEGGCVSYDGGIIGAGWIQSDDGDIEESFGSSDAWVIKLNPDGSKAWVKTYGNARHNMSRQMIKTSDGGYMLAAYGDSYIYGNIYCEGHSGLQYEALVVKLDSDGEIEWHQCFGGSYYDIIIDVIEVEDGYLFIGSSNSHDLDLPRNYGEDESTDIWVFKTSITGELIWSKNYGGSDWDSASNIFENSDGTFTVFGKSKSHNYDVQGNENPSNTSVVWVFKIDQDGELLYQQPYSENIYTNSLNIARISEYKYIAAATRGDFGCYHSQNNHNDDVYLFEIIDLDGLTPSQAQGPESICLDFFQESYYTTVLVSDTTQPEWLFIPEEAGEITIVHDSVVIKWNPNFYDTAWLQVRAVCSLGASSYSKPTEIIVHPSLPISDITGPDSLCSVTNTQSIFSATLEDMSLETNWYLQPENAGSINNQQDTAIITWNPIFEGQVSLKTGIINKCDIEEFSNEKEVLVRTCLGLRQEHIKELNLYPNPATNQITFELPQINKQSQLQIKDIYGKVITTLSIKPNQSQLIWECGGFASGVYFYEAEIGGEVYRGKVILQD